MISAPVHGNVQFYYEDSGAPAEDVYTTLVVIHGTSYHSAIFHRLVPFAARHNLRLVFLNRRDYPDTTYMTPEEIEKIRSPNQEDNAGILRELGLQIGSFLAWYVRSAGIPPVNEVGKGGLSVLAWSSGNVQTSAMVANLNGLGGRDKILLQEYMRTYVIYDSPAYIFGLSPAPEIYSPFRDPSLTTIEAKAEYFNVWITSYWQHPDPDSGTTAGLSMHEIENPPPEKMPTIYRFGPGEMDAVTCSEALLRGEGYVRYMPLEVFRENIMKIFGDVKLVDEFPGMKIKLIWCRESNPEISWASHQLKDCVNELTKEGKAYRELEMYSMSGNHFAHWDQPEQTLQFWSTLV